MYALIEIIDEKASVILVDDIQCIEKYMVEWYNNNVKKAEYVDWKHTKIIAGEYAMIYDGKVEKRLLTGGIIERKAA